MKNITIYILAIMFVACSLFLGCAILGVNRSEKTPIEIINPKDGSVLIEIPAGNFTMGSTADDTLIWTVKWLGVDMDQEFPKHTVYLEAYKISKYEITNAQYEAFMDAGGYSNIKYWTTDGWTWITTNNRTEPCWWSKGWANSGPNFPNYPVAGVSWYEAYAYCQWAGGHLPTEAQWEKAARGNSTSSGNNWPWGSIWDASKCNSGLNSSPDTFAYSSPVDNFKADASYYGVHDMAGNVSEWCNDWYSETYYRDSIVTSFPIGPSSGEQRAIRGGDWETSAFRCRSACRTGTYPWVRLGYLGFRLAK